MSATRKNLSHCPRCDTALDRDALECGNCEYKEIENFDLLDIGEQREYKEYLQSQRAAWVAFDQALRNKLRELGDGWSRLEKWKPLWKFITPLAEAVHFGERATNKRAEHISKEPPEEKPKPPEISPHLEAVRVWVANLPDGEVDTIVWRQFLHSLTGPVDDSLLETFRDAEISRQFAEFETARVDAQETLRHCGRRRVKRFVENLGNGSELVMLMVPEGQFRMGSERYKWERPIHSVDVGNFYLGQFPVTQAQWRAIVRMPKVDIELEENCSAFIGDNLPVDSVTWAEAAEFCARLAKQTGKPYRLPSEAEWEYACSAGNSEEFSFGPTITPVIINYDGTQPFGGAAAGISRNGTMPVGSLAAANDFGFYDMHGNLCEWCEDEWHENYEGAPENGSAWISGDLSASRVTRGGSWSHSAEICRSRDRSHESADPLTRLHYMGFRVAASF